MMTKHHEIRFGVVAVKKGFVIPEQVVEALEVQVREDLSTGKHRRIGKILLEQQKIDDSQLNEVLHTLTSEIPLEG
ncbi:MAG: hypothetical protein JRI86_14855 [Deltaproteobacteria bacterium]|nr:hypothetical protein [Deltaproteobacteria bacterium]